jgi:hypothetical protein
MSVDINTCYETTKAYHTIALYSHSVPIAIAMFLGLFAFFRKRSPLTIVFLIFVTSFCLWLAGDLVDWLSTNYFFVYYAWSWLDFINIAFFVLGAYFFSLLALGRVTTSEKYFFIGVLIPAFLITALGHSVID